MGKTTWTDERVETLKSLWGAGKTAAEIAKELGEGLTRNAVIGKAHRLGLSGRITPVTKKVDKPLPPNPRISCKNGGISLLLTEKHVVIHMATQKMVSILWWQCIGRFAVLRVNMQRCVPNKCTQV